MDDQKAGQNDRVGPDELFDAYLASLGSDTPLDREEMVRLHPDRASDLRRLFGEYDLAQAMKQAGELTGSCHDNLEAGGEDGTELPDGWRVGDYRIDGGDDSVRVLGRGGMGTVSLRAFRGSAREPDLTTAERLVGDYELLEKVGGNMGVVYRARQRSLPREVAVKLLLRAGAGARERFRAETEAMARLHHPHVVRILEVARGDGPPFFGMEWYPGEALAGRVAEFAGRPDRAAEVVEKVARPPTSPTIWRGIGRGGRPRPARSARSGGSPTSSARPGQHLPSGRSGRG